MKYIFIIILIIFISKSVSSQSNYIDYHKRILEAKMCLVDSSYEKSLDIFREEFQKYDFVFVRDCFLAAQIACFCNNDTLIKYFIEIGIKHGIMKETFLKDKITSLVKDKNLWKEILFDYDSLRQYYLNKINWNVRKKLNEMAKEEYTIFTNSRKFYNLLIRKKISNRIDSLHIYHIPYIKEITTTLGFPSNKIIGIGDNISYKSYNSELNSIDAISILHRYKKTYREMGSILFECIKKGELDPMYYAYIVDFDEIYHKKRKKRRPYYNYLVTNFKKDLDEDIHRKEIGLPTRQQEKKLWLVRKKTGLKCIYCFW